MDVEQDVSLFRQQYDALHAELAKVIVGHDEVLHGVLTAIFTGGHCLLEGVPGLGKTLLVRTLGQALSLAFSRIQFTPDLMPADIIGTDLLMESPDGRRRFEFQKGPLFAQVLLADEINRATPKTQSALLEAMQERCVTVGGQSYALDPPFFVMATQNPIEQEGTYPLPEAQLDRFAYKLIVGYSSREEVNEILNRTTTPAATRATAVMDGPAILRWQDLVRQVVVAPPVQDYAVRLTLATHPHSELATRGASQYVRFGASPRGAQHLVLGAKVRALRAGRYNAGFEDVRSVALPALRHRLILNFEGEAAGKSTDDLVREVLEQVPAEAR